MFNRLKLRPVLLSVGFSANILLVLIPLAKILICSNFLNRLLSSIHHLIAKGLYIYLPMANWSLRAAKLTKHFTLFHSVTVGLTRKLEISKLALYTWKFSLEFSIFDFFLFEKLALKGLTALLPLSTSVDLHLIFTRGSFS